MPEGYGGMECEPGACRFSAMYTVKKIWRKLADGGAEEVTTLQEAVIFSERESY